VGVYYKSVNCNPLTLLLRSVVQLVSTVDKILSDLARRAVRLRYSVAELLVLNHAERR